MPHATIHVVSVKHTMNEREIVSNLSSYEYKLDQPVKKKMHISSAPHTMQKHGSSFKNFQIKKYNIIFKRGRMKHFYERNDYVLDHEVNKTFEKSLDVR